jgi:ribose transport system ATP-binding protein
MVKQSLTTRIAFMALDQSIALRMTGVTKRFPGTVAVDTVDFEVRAGEVHALMGENGAGKSTLMNVLAGSFQDYTGSIFVNGEPVTLHSPAQAKARGIEMIHQELSLALPLSIAENLLVGHLPTKLGLFLDRAAVERRSRALLARVSLDVDPWAAVETISPHEAQLVEIAKALGSEPSILVMDEPTSSLSRREVAQLFEIISGLKRQGLAIVYISHHLPEVFQVADRVTVMRDGRKVGTHPIDDVTPEKLVELMIGMSVSKTRIQRKTEPGDVRLRVEDFSRYGFFHHVHFTLRRSEILGLVGLAGSGRSELARSLCALDPVDEGTIWLDGEPIEPANFRDAAWCGLAYLTEDRKEQGLALDLALDTNLLVSLQAKRHRLIRPAEQRAVFSTQARDLQLHPPQPARLVRQLSGGNQQKVLLGKWLATAPGVLILDEPTRGVDIGAKQLIHETIGRLADDGMSILLITSDLPEMVALADRVVVLRKGHIIRELQRGTFTEDSLLLAANAENAG